jgi:hypothetical protein
VEVNTPPELHTVDGDVNLYPVLQSIVQDEPLFITPPVHEFKIPLLGVATEQVSGTVH